MKLNRNSEINIQLVVIDVVILFIVAVLIVCVALLNHRVEEVESKVKVSTIERCEPIVEVSDNQWKNLGTFKVTAYCSCEKCCGVWGENRPLDENGKEIVITASGCVAEAGKTIAVDPNIIPYGTPVKIGDTIYEAQDTGGAIVGNHIDLYFDNHQCALEHGVKELEVFVLDEGEVDGND